MKQHPGLAKPRKIDPWEISDEFEIGRGFSGIATRAIFENHIVVVKKPKQGTSLVEQLKEYDFFFCNVWCVL
jgi:hypothetical protein